ncbi:MAG: hypothetical protein KatS3mg032_2560 [Cyclobacteriaceae bacterium]|nr:MAG: hypothetical protein KatS3mg032_2560 [Cyclobacteriaceae bacterium]
MKKSLPIRAYFHRARLFGWLVLLILLFAAGYALLLFFIS